MTAQTQSVGVKETIEALEGLKVVGKFAGKVAADGKVNLKDLPHVVELVKDAGTVVEAVKGANSIPAEIKDLSQEELAQIGAKAIELVKEIRSASVPAVGA